VTADDRRGVFNYLRRQLVGPVSGPTEELIEAPSQRYLMGILFPQRSASEDAFDEDVIDEGQGQIGDETGDDPVTLANQYMPSSVGLSFVVSGQARIEASCRAACYIENETDSAKATWVRNELAETGERHELAPDGAGVLQRQPVFDGLAELAALWRPFGDEWLVTVALVNVQRSDGEHDRAMCLCQVELECRLRSGVFMPYPTADRVPLDPEEEELAVVYRDVPTFAVGHGCAADWDSEGPVAPDLVRAEFLPSQVVPGITFDIEGFDDVRRLATLARMESDTDSVIARLRSFVGAYSDWIDAQVGEATVPPRLAAAVDRLASRLRHAAARMTSGVDLLAVDPLARRAFACANEAMLMQMRHTADDLGGTQRSLAAAIAVPDIDYMQLHEQSWRPFQLAFLLLTLNSVTDPSSSERELVDLIWFPTGGGKTEAYLGLVAYQIALRRLQLGDEGAGTTVITRYTLRLLTTQQFQRAAALTCALERLRQRDPNAMGTIPITIGIWVGGGTSPNWYADAVELFEKLKNGDWDARGFQLESCPWCGTLVVPNPTTDDPNVWGVHPTNDDFRMSCPNPACPFHFSLPVSVVDQHLYDHPPTFLIATLDKFTQLTWNPDTGVFLGAGRLPGPSLIIQDELHLISGPLGTVAALYEAAFDIVMRKCSGAPKIIASTATIRRADQQIRGLFNREAFLFPPSGLSADDSFFVRFDRAQPGRLYAGVMAQSHTPITANVHTAAALLQAPIEVIPDDIRRDPYWTMVAYHNSLRELGKSVTLMSDDVPARIGVIASAKDNVRTYDADDNVIELTSNISSNLIPRNLEKLKTPYGNSRCVAVVASTNMISVGVDVPRLGLMLIVGQPKSTSEYIQASSRVGRANPGLVVTLYSSAKPRDRSHYESFKPYHRALYRQVEPTSVTPFSLPARQRALHAALVVLARFVLGLTDNDDAARFGRGVELDDVLAHLGARVSASDPRELADTEKHLQRLVDDWLGLGIKAEATGGLLYRAPGRQHVALLKQFNEAGPGWATMNSMRNIDVECLIRVHGEQIR
jgi:hypothetical protein